MALKEKLTEDLKEAMRARDKVRLDTIRALITEIKNTEIALRTAGKSDVIDEAEELAILSRARKQREESILAFRNGGREDLATNEEAQREVILGYLPKQLDEAEVQALIAQVVAEVGATSKKDMGKVMGKLMPQVKGRFPGDKLKPLVEGALG